MALVQHYDEATGTWTWENEVDSPVAKSTAPTAATAQTDANGLPLTGNTPGQVQTKGSSVFQWDGTGWIPYNNDNNPYANAHDFNTGGNVLRPSTAGDQNVTGAGSGGPGAGLDTTSLGGMTAPFTEPFNPPQYKAPQLPQFQTPQFQTPQYNIPAYTPPPAFSYQDWQTPDPFKAPSLEEAQATPGYQFRLGQGLNAINNSAAAQGSLLTGGTFKGLQDYAQNFANSNYQNDYNNQFGVWSANANQSLQNYATNRANAADTYNTNYHTQFIDPYNYSVDAAKIQNQNNLTGALTQNQNALTGATTQNSNAMQGYDTDVSQQNLGYDHARQDWLNRRDTFWGNQNNSFSKYFQTASLGAGAAA